MAIPYQLALFSKTHMVKTRACDACALRKVRCDGNVPCRGCFLSSVTCTNRRIRGKSVPKGLKQSTMHNIAKAQQEHSGDGNEGPHVDYDYRTTFCALGQTIHAGWSVFPDQKIPLSSLWVYIDIYHHKLYPVWPIVHRDHLKSRLQNTDDVEAYAIATAVCAATISQLRLRVGIAGDTDTLAVDHTTMASEAERARTIIEHLELSPVANILCAFFLHVFYANMGKYKRSTILLRESITYTHILGLHHASHYAALTHTESQQHLRIVWLLFITER